MQGGRLSGEFIRLGPGGVFRRWSDHGAGKGVANAQNGPLTFRRSPVQLPIGPHAGGQIYHSIMRHGRRGRQSCGERCAFPSGIPDPTVPAEEFGPHRVVDTIPAMKLASRQGDSCIRLRITIESDSEFSRLHRFEGKSEGSASPITRPCGERFDCLPTAIVARFEDELR